MARACSHSLLYIKPYYGYTCPELYTLQFSRGQEASAFMLLAFVPRSIKCSFHERTTVYKGTNRRARSEAALSAEVLCVYKYTTVGRTELFLSSADLKLEACRLQCWPRAEQAITVYDPSQYTRIMCDGQCR